MKNIIATGLMLLGLGVASANAQGSNSYDDIYYSPSDAKKEAKENAKTQEEEAARKRANDNNRTYNASFADDDNYDNNGNNEDAYIDYDNDDYYYSTQINRFNYPFYNRPYYSTFYNPNWYNPFWVDPFWGYNPWRSGFSVSFGSGPYWSSGWGYNTWGGYGGFNSCWNYPYYAGGWGGSSWYGSPYYGGYWNGYYSGLYNNHGYSGYGNRTVSYAPRYTLNNNGNSGGGFRNGYRGNDTRGGYNTTVSTPRPAANGGFRTREADGNRFNTPEGRNNNGSFSENSSRSGSARDTRVNGRDGIQNGGQTTTPDSRRGRFESNDRNSNDVYRGNTGRDGGNYSAPRSNDRYNGTPRIETTPQRQREVAPQRNYSAPERSYSPPPVRQREVTPQRQQPTYSAPERSYSQPQRSNNNSGGGGGFNGGRSSGGSNGGRR